MSPHYTPESSRLQEVLYLHALWHSQVSPNPRPAAAFKNTRRKKTNRRPSDAPPSSEIKRRIARSSPPPSASKKRKETNHRLFGAPSTAEVQRPIVGSNPLPSASKKNKKRKKQPDAPAPAEIEWPCPPAAFKNTKRKKTNRRPSDAPPSSEIKRQIARSSPPPSASKKRKETNHRSFGAPSTTGIQRPIAGSNPPPSVSKKNKKRKKQPDAPAPAEIEWPCPPAPITETVGWDDLTPSPAPAPPPSAEDQARAAALLAQRPGLRACQEFFSSKNESDDEDGEEDDLIDGDGGGGSFLLGLFEKDGDLRGYYEKNCDKGEFCCLVCWGIGEKKGKRFPDCVGLVQHCNSICKTKRKGAHRGLAKAVCRVLAWDINRLPSIVLDLGDPLGKSLEKAAESKEALKDVANEKEELQKEDVELVNNNTVDQMDCIGTKDIADLLNRESGNDVEGEFLKEACEKAVANNGNLECTKTREVTNLSKEEHNEMK